MLQVKAYLRTIVYRVLFKILSKNMDLAVLIRTLWYEDMF